MKLILLIVHLLIEMNSTNSLTYSNDFSNSAWSKDSSSINTSIGTNGIQSNVSTSPEGKLNASRVNFTLNSDKDTGLREGVSASSGTTHSFSVYVKGEGSNIGKSIDIRVKRSTGGSFVGSDLSVTLTSNWQRAKVNPLTLVTGNSGVTAIISSNDATSCLIYGSQMEEGNYSSSYIPTSGSAQTRASESCTGAGDVNTFNSVEGILYAELKRDIATDNGFRRININDGSLNNTVRLGYSTVTDEIKGVVTVGGSTQCALVFSGLSVTSFRKMALLYKANQFELWVDGSKRAEDTSGSTFSTGTLNDLSFEQSNGSDKLRAKVKDVRYYDTDGMSNTEITNLLTQLTQ